MSTQALAAQSVAAAEEVLRARSALGTACRWDGSAEAIASAREALRVAKLNRLKADLAVLEADPLAARRQVLVVADSDPEVRPSHDMHASLAAKQAEAVREFFESHPRPRVEDYEPDPWDAATHRSYAAVLAAFRVAHEALGCSELAPCRADAR